MEKQIHGSIISGVQATSRESRHPRGRGRLAWRLFECRAKMLAEAV